MRSCRSSSRSAVLATSWYLDWLYFLYTDTSELVGALLASAARVSATGRNASSLKLEYFCRPCKRHTVCLPHVRRVGCQKQQWLQLGTIMWQLWTLITIICISSSGAGRRASAASQAAELLMKLHKHMHDRELQIHSVQGMALQHCSVRGHT